MSRPYKGKYGKRQTVQLSLAEQIITILENERQSTPSLTLSDAIENILAQAIQDSGIELKEIDPKAKQDKGFPEWAKGYG